MLYDLLFCSIFLIAGFALWDFEPLWCRKLGCLLIWSASGFGTYFLTGSTIITAVILLSWIVFPLWEMVFILRQFRISQHRALTDARAPFEDFEDLEELTAELTTLGFETVDECKIRRLHQEQYCRLFIHRDGQTMATINYLLQGPIGFHFVTFSSFAKNGSIWTTWDYPLTYGLLMPERLHLYRVLEAESTDELFQLHQEFCSINEVKPEDLQSCNKNPEAIRAKLQQILDEQVQYNMEQGFLAPTPHAVEPGELRYSWKGTLYVARQVLRDLLF